MKTKMFMGALLLILAMACNENENAYAGYDQERIEESEVPATTKMSENGNAQKHEKAIKQQLIKTGHLAFQVENLKRTHAFLIDNLNAIDGYVSRDEESQGYNNRVNHYLEVRIPAAKFDHYLSEISNEVHHFDDKTIEVRDVTDQFVDLDARLNSKKELESRYLALLDRAKTMDEILQIEREINNLRTEIESVEGRMRLMKDQISYATLSINYYTTEVAQAQGFSSKLGHELISGWDGLLSFLLVLFRIWPFLILMAIATLIIRFQLKAKKVKA